MHAQARPGLFPFAVATWPFAARVPAREMDKPSPEEKTRMHTQNVNVKTAAQETAGRWGEKTMRTPVITLSSNLVPLRGLDVRMAWGMAQVMRVIDSDKADEEMESAVSDALISGHNDFNNGIDTPPGTFLDVPLLVRSWREGWRSAAVSEAMQSCSGCNNERGEPCPWHD